MTEKKHTLMVSIKNFTYVTVGAVESTCLILDLLLIIKILICGNIFRRVSTFYFIDFELMNLGHSVNVTAEESDFYDSFF